MLTADSRCCMAETNTNCKAILPQLKKKTIGSTYSVNLPKKKKIMKLHMLLHISLGLGHMAVPIAWEIWNSLIK